MKNIGGNTAESVFPHLVAALNSAAELYVRTWRKFATGLPVPPDGSVVRSSGPYHRSIQSDTANPLEKIIFTDSPVHKYIEDGAPETDLKPGLLAGPKSRPTLSGGRMNIISFRHGVPSAARNPLPDNIYQKMLQETQRAESKRQASTGGVRAVLPKGEGGTPQTKVSEQFGVYRWKVGQYEGLRRIDTSVGRGHSSKYLTFRVVSTNSDPASWIVPERKPIPIRHAVVDLVTPVVEKMLKDSFELDIS